MLPISMRVLLITISLIAVAIVAWATLGAYEMALGFLFVATTVVFTTLPPSMGPATGSLVENDGADGRQFIPLYRTR